MKCSISLGWPKVGPPNQKYQKNAPSNAAHGWPGQTATRRAVAKEGVKGEVNLPFGEVWKKGKEPRRNDLHARPEGSADSKSEPQAPQP